MDSPTNCGHHESNLRRYTKSGLRSSKKSLYAYSDICEDTENLQLGQRSISLTALHTDNRSNSSVIGEPARMTQLENLEAKMANIEVSLSTTNNNTTPVPNTNCNASVRSNKRLKNVSPASTILLRPEKVTKELETLKNTLKDKENVIQSLKSQLGIPHPISYSRRSSKSILNESDRKCLEDRQRKMEKEIDNKKLAIKNLKFAFEKLDVSDNIDVRIQQAELEYQLEREGLNLLNLEEDARNIKERIKESDECRKKTEGNALFSIVSEKMNCSIHAVKVSFDCSNPCFTVNPKEGNAGLYITWAKEKLDMKKGDRLVEVNGRLCLTISMENLSKLLSTISSEEEEDEEGFAYLRLLLLRCQPQLPQRKELSALRCELSVLSHRYQEERQRYEEVQGMLERVTKERDMARGDQIRLSHRIGYLEEQVTELQRSLESALTNCASASRMVSHDQELMATVRSKSRHHFRQTLASAIFQKGSHRTTVPAEVTLTDPIVCVKSPEAIRRYSSHSNTVRVQPQTHLRARLLETLRRVSPPNCDTRSVDSLPSVTVSESGHHHKHKASKPPPPPKKPSRLSLHRATSVQSVDAAITDAQRSATKRSHKSQQSSLKPWPSMEHTAPSTTPQQKSYRSWATLTAFRSGSAFGLAPVKGGEKWC